MFEAGVLLASEGGYQVRFVASVIIVVTALGGCSQNTASRPRSGQDMSRAPSHAPASPEALGMVLGKQLTLQDLRPSADTLKGRAEGEHLESGDAWLKLHRGELLQGAILGALMQKYIKDHHLEVQDAEIDEFERHMGQSAAM